MPKGNMLRMVLTAIILVLITAFLISPLVTLAQGTWGSDQLIEDNASVGDDGEYTVVELYCYNVGGISPARRVH